MTVGLVLVSHSAQLAAGLAQVARQMAADVTIRPAGGLEDGSIGTSFDLIGTAIAEADTGDGAVLLYDLGSGFLTAETAVEFLEGEQAQRVVIVDTPFVLGAVSAAIAANLGSDLRGVVGAPVQTVFVACETARQTSGVGKLDASVTA